MALMQPRIPIIERAFLLARSGQCENVRDIKTKLRAEGYILVDQYIDGPSLLKKLKHHCAQPDVLHDGLRDRRSVAIDAGRDAI
jgi:hypothetical protein